MALTPNELLQYMYDPARAQEQILNHISEAVNGKLDIADPNNPFTMLLEAVSTVGGSNIINFKNMVQLIHPNLATNLEALYHHLSDDELANMFAIPAEANIAFYINIIELNQFGYRPNGADYVELVIPEYTTVTVADTTFTLLNDILIRRYDSGNIFVEQQTSTEDIAVNDIGILDSAVTTDSNAVPWLIFETRLKQVTRKVIKDTIIAAEGFQKKTPLTDQYFYSKVSYKNNSTGSNYARLRSSFTDEFIDPVIPTVYISRSDTEVIHRIPDVYIIDGGVSGNVTIELYETKGNLVLPINVYGLNDFDINIGNSGKSAASAASTQMTIRANSRDIVNGGRDITPLETIKESIIFNTSGDIDLPITEYDIKKNGYNYGFEIYKAMDILTERVYIANKELVDISDGDIDARADVFFNTVKLIVGEISDMSTVTVDADIIIIKSGTVFKEVNGIVSIVTDTELNIINAMTPEEKIVYLANNTYFFTPFYYIIDKSDIVVDSRVYNLDQTQHGRMLLVSKNNNVNARINTNAVGFGKTPTGYRYLATITSNTDFENIDPRNLYMQLTIPIPDSGLEVKYKATYDEITGYFIFDINTDCYVNSNGYLKLTNGEAPTSLIEIELLSKATIHIYAIDAGEIDETRFLHGEIYETSTDSLVVYSKETIDLTFGNSIKYIWNKVSNTFTERKYLKYDADVLAFYDKDVYEIDPETGSIFSVVGGDVVYNKIHNAGDPVLDNENNQVYLHRKGDVILDENGLPTIDQSVGVIRYIDILMFEYVYKLANSKIYTNYLTSIIEMLTLWLVNNLDELNSKMLENTIIQYRTYRQALPVKIFINNVTHSLPYKARPSVTLYSKRDGYSKNELLLIKNTIGQIIHNHLDKLTVSYSDIKDEIKETLGSDILGVKITGIDNGQNIEVFSSYNKTSRLALDKRLELNSNNELIVRYNIDLTINKV